MGKTKKSVPQILTSGSAFYQTLNKGFDPKTKEISKNWAEKIVDDDKDPLKKMSDDLTKKMAIAKQIKDLEVSGVIPKKQIEKMKRDAGLIVDEEDDEVEEESGVNPMLIQLLKEERDPEVRKAMIMASLGGKGGKMSEMMVLTQLMQPNVRPHEEQTVMSKILDKFLDSQFSNNKDPEDKVLEKMSKYKEIFGVANNGGDTVDNLLNHKRKLEELGLVGGSDPKLELELEKLKLEHEDRRAQIDLEGKKNDQLGEIIEGGVAALMGALPALRGGAQPEQRQESDKQVSDGKVESIPVECPKCKRKMNIPKPYDKREVKCSTKECSVVYHIEGDGNAYLDKEEPGENNEETK